MTIVNFHKRFITVGFREANGSSSKILELIEHRSKDMKAFYGKFCINYKKSEYLISHNIEYINQLVQEANSNFSLSDLFLK